MNPIEISSRFIRYYQHLGFELLPSAPLLDPSIPMSFVMSAGLVQVEAALDRLGQRSGQKYVLLQKCFRHFDVDTIGASAIHLSLFEMPGAFYFGATEKATTIQRMWQLLTSALGIPSADLWVTYFAGDQVFGSYVEEDTETRQTWQAIGLPPSRIVGLDSNSNFWKQGNGAQGLESSRKCGPNTEVFFDRGVQWACGPNCRPGCRCGRFVEFANSLFINLELAADGKLVPVSNPFTETVIGTERVAMILQGKPSVFEIDELAPIVQTIRQFCAAPGHKPASEHIIADHLRALLFLAADGAPPPGKDGRQRIIKILIRNVLTHQMILDIASPDFIPAIVTTIVQLHPRLRAASSLLLDYIALESPRFRRTVQSGQRRLDEYLATNGGRTLQGAQILLLEKKFGLPSVLTARLLETRGLEFRREEYNLLLQNWKSRWRNDSAPLRAFAYGG